MPIEARVTTKFDPPYEIKGKGIPVSGNKATIAPRLIIICEANKDNIPEDNNCANLSGAFLTIL